MRLSLGYKLLLLFGIMAVLFMGFSLYVYLDVKEFETDIQNYKSNTKEILLVKDIQLNAFGLSHFITGAALAGDTRGINREAGTFLDKAYGDIDDLLKTGDESGHQQEIIELKKDLQAMWETGRRMIEAYSDDRGKGDIIKKEFDDLVGKTTDKINVIVNEENSEGHSMAEEMFRMAGTSLNIIITVICLGLIIGSAILFYIRSLSRSITGPLAQLVKAAGAMSSGDLSTEIKDIKGNTEVSELANNFNTMVRCLRDIVSGVKDGVIKLAASAEDLSASAIQIVEGSREQNMKSAQVATASHELNATILDVAKNVSGAAESARETNRVASSGGEIVEKSIISINSIADTSQNTCKVMSVLGRRSDEVGSIIKVIDDIANQTNLLALNAAIEAARAGEQGRGFAVVADEVRKLAEKTSEATKEIGETIKIIQQDTNSAMSSMDKEIKAVKDGVNHARDAGAALNDIVDKVEQVSSMIEQIAAASEEQSTAAEQISGDIEMVANIARETSDNAQKIADSSQAIAILAHNLRSSINMFRMSDADGGQVDKGDAVFADRNMQASSA